MPWPIVSGLLARLDMIEFRRHAHTALLAHVVVASMGGAKNGKLTDYLLSFAQLEMGSGQSWKASFLDSAAAETDLRLAVRCGYVSQHVFDCLTT